MAKTLATVVIALIVLGAVTQLVIPGFVERHVESQLEEDSEGGEAVVDAKAFPAVRLLFGHGDLLEVRGRGLRVDLDDETDDPLSRLDSFDEVDIDLTDLTAGPVDVQAFSLVKGEDDEDYALRMEGETTPVALAEAVGDSFGGALGRLVAGTGASALPGGGTINLPIDMDATVRREDGELIVESEGANVSGIPIDPFAEAMVTAVLRRL
jgi:hypothetical protein